MEERVFWELLERACEMGKFVVAVPNAAASANIVGKIRLGYDDGEKVLQKKKCPGCHVHFRPEQISEFAFVHLNPGGDDDNGTTAEPCLEIRSTGGKPVLRLYYRGKKAVRRYDEFMRANAHHEALISGSWAADETESGGGVVAAGGDNFISDGSGTGSAG